MCKKDGLSRIRAFVKLTVCVALFAMLLCGCKSISNPEDDEEKIDLVRTGELPLSYATGYTIDMYEGDIRLITIGDDSRFLLVPKASAMPKEIPEGTTVLRTPIDNVYMASSSSMDYLRKLNVTDRVLLSGIKEEDWYLPDIKEAMQKGDILYAGKYNMPDYELILDKGCELAIENTMINHNPEAMEKLQDLGIPVLVERSSYEENPLGRMEWIKLYGVLFGCEDEAIAYYDQILADMERVMAKENTGLSVAFFYVTSNNYINVRKSKDYIARLIAMAGGRYIFENLGEEEDNALATVNLQQEAFYAGAKDADVLIYNSSIMGQVNSISDIVALCPILSDFKAVKNKEVYCTSGNFFQEPLGMSQFAIELSSILNGEDNANMVYLYKLD